MSGLIVGYGVVASGGRYLVIFAGIADVFLTVLHPGGFGFLSSRLYGGLFYSMRFLARPMPRRLRALVLSMAAPLMVPIVIGIWIILVLTGYACVYYVGMNGERGDERRDLLLREPGPRAFLRPGAVRERDRDLYSRIR